jgi:hypothetical protein
MGGMTTLKANLLPLTITPGVQPSTDKTPLATPHYVAATAIRFRFGFPEKIGGWASIIFNAGATIIGIARSLFSTILTTSVDTLIGTNSSLFFLSGSSLTNITPLQTGTIAIANSLSTDFRTLANNPITTVNGSGIITISDTNAAKYQAGDLFTLSGANTVNGITNTILNAQHIIHTVGASSYTTITSGTASSSGSGGGNAVVLATGRITVAATAHGLPNGNRVLIASAVAAGGVTALQINLQWIIRNVTTNTFDIYTAGMATSSVSAAGGAATTYQPQIASGAVNQGTGVGYGMGLYGAGLYGTALMSSSLGTYPQIWFMDRFGVNVIATPGNQGGLYAWTGTTTTAPALIVNAPTAINYAFVSNNIIVTFGAGNVPNYIATSDQSNMTQWTGSSSNQVFQYTVNGASTLITHVPVAGVNLIFTPHQTYLFQYIGLPLIWSVTLLEQNVGIIGPMARVAIAGTAYWMDVNGFWMWAGGNVTPIPANTQENSTILHYVFQNLNSGQAYKSFAWYNEQFQEIWFHYPSASSNEPNMIARYHIVDQTWVPDTMDRVCAEYPNLSLGYPRLISSGSTLYQHETGTDADGSPLAWSLTTNLRGGSNLIQRAYGIAPKEISLLSGFIPDSYQTGNINVNITAKRFPQSSLATYNQNYTVTPTTEFITTEIGGRFWQYTVSGSALGQAWRAGQWMEYVQPSSMQ